MAGFCRECGAKLKDGAKFCSECGAKAMPKAEPQTAPVFTEPVKQTYGEPVQQSYEPPVEQSREPLSTLTPTPPQSYEPPVEPTYEAPVQHTYGEPVQQTYAPPVQPSYEAPVQKTYGEPVQQAYDPPVQPTCEASVQRTYGEPVEQTYEAPAEQAYEPPVQQAYEPPVQQAYEPPVQQTYEAPVQQNYEAPVQQTYEAPVQQTYEAPVQQAYAPPAKKKKEKAAGGGKLPPTGNYAPPDFAQPQGEKKPKKKGGVIALVIVLAALVIVGAVALTFILRGLGGSGERYDCLYYQVGDYRGDPEGEWVELKKNGKAKLFLMNQEFKGKWEQDGSDFFLAQAGDTYYGTLEDGLLELEIMGTRYFFAGEDYIPEQTQENPEIPFLEEPVAPEGPEDPVVPDVLNSPYAWWDGDFYGWWVIKETNQDWHSGDEFTFWDVCAHIDVNNDNTGYVELWDTDCAVNEVFAQVDVYFGGGTTQYGAMMSEGGFLYGHELEHAEWIVDLGVSDVSMIDQMICIDGSFEDPGGDFDYLIFLRPWGMDWEDVRQATGDALFFSDMMPAHYDDWYLPRMNDPMPEYFEGIVFP